MEQDSASGRVMAFIADWGMRWDELGGADASGDAWSQAVDEMRRDHFCREGSGPSPEPSAVPKHRAGRELVVESKVVGEAATTHSQITAGGQTAHFEYQLIQIEDDWRIESVRESSRPFPPLEGSPAVMLDEQRRETFDQTAVEGGLADLPAHARPLGDSAFVVGTRVRDSTATGRQVVGELEIRSGVVAAQEIHNEMMWAFHPVTRRVSPGRYPVTVAMATADDSVGGGPRILATRLSLRDAPIERWVGASLTDRECLASAYAGTLCLLDADTYAQATKFELEQFIRSLEDVEDVVGHLYPLKKEGDCAVIVSGYGDRSAACYWGVDREDQPVCLQLEFEWHPHEVEGVDDSFPL